MQLLLAYHMALTRPLDYLRIMAETARVESDMAVVSTLEAAGFL